MDFEILTQYGVDYQKGIERCLNDEVFYEKILTLFLKDESFANAKNAYECGDDAALFTYVHELKGVSGNAELTELYEAVYPLVEVLRKEDFDRDAMEKLYDAMSVAYAKTREGVFLALNG